MSKESTCTRSSCWQPPWWAPPALDVWPFPQGLVYRGEVISAVLCHLSTRGNTDISLFIYFPPPLTRVQSLMENSGRKGKTSFATCSISKPQLPAPRTLPWRCPAYGLFPVPRGCSRGARVGEKGKGQGKGRDRGVCSLFKLKRREKESPASFKVG